VQDDFSEDWVPGLEDYELVDFDEPRADYYWAVQRARSREAYKRLQHTKVDQGWADVTTRLVMGGEVGQQALRAVVEYTSDPNEKAEVIEFARDWLYPYDRLPTDFGAWLEAQGRAHPAVAETLRLIERYAG
jgi:hypothetical protein